MIKQPTLLVEPTGTQPGWPAGTLEANLLQVTSELQASRQNNLYMIVYRWLGSDDSAPYQEVLRMIEQGLGMRGLMVEVDARALGIFKYKKLELPDSTPPTSPSSQPPPSSSFCRTASNFVRIFGR